MIDNNTKNNINQSDKLEYYSSGSFGVVLKRKNNSEFVYKITEFTDYKFINENNFMEMIYLNYFKKKYDSLYRNDKICNVYLPMQNEKTKIYQFENFCKLYRIEEQLIYKIKTKLNITFDSLIIVNKMKFYPYNLSKYLTINENINIKYCNIDIIENIILGLHLIHSNNLVHGDLKSLNIVTDGINCRLIDFGGIKHIENNNYECSCTITYRSPEDIEYEFEKNKQILNYPNDYIKSELWSLGIILHELLYFQNPIQKKYLDYKNKYKYDDDNEFQICKKLNSYYKSIESVQIPEKEKNSFIYEINDKEEQLIIFKINNIIENLLFINYKKRNSLEQIYLELFCQELPDFDKNKKIFKYKIEKNEHNILFLDFRKFYYKYIKKITLDRNEIYLYPFIVNLLDRFIITMVNIFNDPNKSNEKIKPYEFIINIINNDLVGLDKFDEINDLNILFDGLGILFCSIYLVAIIIMNKKSPDIKNFVKTLLNKLNELFDLNLDILENKYKIVIINIVEIFEILDWDIIRPKLCFFQYTTKSKLLNVINILDDFDILQIEKIIE
jgi:serine/threonine protein kinase